MEELRELVRALEREVHALRAEVAAYRDELRTSADAIVTRTSERVRNDFFTEVGKTVITRLFYIIGLVVVGLALWLAGSGKLPLLIKAAP